MKERKRPHSLRPALASTGQPRILLNEQRKQTAGKKEKSVTVKKHPSEDSGRVYETVYVHAPLPQKG